MDDGLATRVLLLRRRGGTGKGAAGVQRAPGPGVRGTARRVAYDVHLGHFEPVVLGELFGAFASVSAYCAHRVHEAVTS
jgi:hypothetical protein